MSKKTIALFTSTQGHYSIYLAIKEKLEKKFNVVTFYKRDPLMDVYVLLYQFFPGGYKFPFVLTQNKTALKMIYPLYLNRYWKEIQEFCIEKKADLYISTFLGFNPSIEEFTKTDGKPFLNVITDPRTIHPLLLSSSAKFNYVFDEEAVEFTHKFDSEISTKIVGWFVRSQFEEAYDVKAVRKQLKLNTDKLTFLLASGSEGTNFIATVLPSLIGSSTPVQIVIACGTNKNLYKSMKFLQKMMRKTKSKVSIIPISFTQQIHLYMQAADLIIGKAGPNTLFEAVATQTPFFAITHISGQEDGNLDVIREYKLGYVEENPFKAAKLLKKIITSPKQLQEFQPYLKKMAQHNSAAKQQIFDDVEKILEDQ